MSFGRPNQGLDLIIDGMSNGAIDNLPHQSGIWCTLQKAVANLILSQHPWASTHVRLKERLTFGSRQ